MRTAEIPYDEFAVSSPLIFLICFVAFCSAKVAEENAACEEQKPTLENQQDVSQTFPLS